MFKKKKITEDIINLSGKIEIQKDTGQAIISVNASTGDQWVDFGYWMEVTSFMAKQAMQHKGWSEDEMKKYIQSYLEEAFATYSVDEPKDNK